MRVVSVAIPIAMIIPISTMLNTVNHVHVILHILSCFLFLYS